MKAVRFHEHGSADVLKYEASCACGGGVFERIPLTRELSTGSRRGERGLFRGENAGGGMK